MQFELLESLRCPVTRTKLTLKTIKEESKKFDTATINVVTTGILFSESEWFYPIINGIPRLCVESFLDHKDFFAENMNDYASKATIIQTKYALLLNFVIKKNKRTKESFTKEWNLFDYKSDKTWDADEAQMLQRFYNETAETQTSLQNMFVFDAGCGNGKLNHLLGIAGIKNIGMDFSKSVEAAYLNNPSVNTHFIQGDVQYPPVAFNCFDLVHCSGVLIATNNTELSFSCLTPTLKENGKLSVWLYHPRKGFIHNTFNFLRNITSTLPLRLQYFIYYTTLFPISYCIKKMKGNKQNSREMMVDILDWFTPQFRWEHTTDEATSWYHKRGFTNIKVTTMEVFGFNITGNKIN
jgi:ubiquinone/menaquinone biosynthesis C-methylase UbiE/uncharacterized protein YbaR (Trm112 family)